MKKTTHYTGHRWTNDEIKDLMKQWVEEVPLLDIATNLKVSQLALLKQIQRLRLSGIPLPNRTKGHQLGIKNRNWTQGETEYLIRRRNEKANCTEIGNELNRSPNSIQAMIQTLRKENVYVAMRGCGVRKKWDAEYLKGLLLTNSFE